MLVMAKVGFTDSGPMRTRAAFASPGTGCAYAAGAPAINPMTRAQTNLTPHLMRATKLVDRESSCTFMLREPFRRASLARRRPRAAASCDNAAEFRKWKKEPGRKRCQ